MVGGGGSQRNSSTAQVDGLTPTMYDKMTMNTFAVSGASKWTRYALSNGVGFRMNVSDANRVSC